MSNGNYRDDWKKDNWKRLIEDEKWVEGKRLKKKHEEEMDEWSDMLKMEGKGDNLRSGLGTVKDIAMFFASGGFEGLKESFMPDEETLAKMSGDGDLNIGEIAGDAAGSKLGEAMAYLSGSGVIDMVIDDFSKRVYNTEKNFLDKIGFMNMQDEDFAWAREKAQDIDKGWERAKKSKRQSLKTNPLDFIDIEGLLTAGEDIKTPTGDDNNFRQQLMRVLGGKNE